MQTATSLKKLRAQAKQVSKYSDLSYQQILEQLARNHGYRTWQECLGDVKASQARAIPQLIAQFDECILELNDALTEYRDRLSLYQDDLVQEVYAPIDFINLKARIVVVGLTPGDQQATDAIRAYRKARAESPISSALSIAKITASFSGPIRKNLTAMLDHIGIAAAIGIDSTHDGFQEGNDIFHFTSMLRNPVFYKNENYSGVPAPDKHPHLAARIAQSFRSEMALFDKALFIPLGQHVNYAFRQLTSTGVIDESRVLFGMPHPSGANAERISYFLGRKEATDLSRQTNPQTIDAARTELQEKVRLFSVGQSAEKPTINTDTKEHTTMGNASILTENKPFGTLVEADGFMSKSVEKQLIAIAGSKDFRVSEIEKQSGKRTTKAKPLCGIRQGREELVYYTRNTGLKKGLLLVVVRPEIGPDTDLRITGIPEVSLHSKRMKKGEPGNPRILYSSNYSGYDNKRHAKGRHNEHSGWAYSIDVSEGLEGFAQFLDALSCKNAI